MLVVTRLRYGSVRANTKSIVPHNHNKQQEAHIATTATGATAIFQKMIEGTLNRNRKPKRTIMVRVATVVSLVLLAGLVEEVRPVPVPVPALLRLLVFEKAVDVYHILRQPEPSSVEEDEGAAARADTHESGGRELLAQTISYEDYACTDCVIFFMWVGGWRIYSR